MKEERICFISFLVFAIISSILLKELIREDPKTWFGFICLSVSLIFAIKWIMFGVKEK